MRFWLTTILFFFIFLSCKKQEKVELVIPEECDKNEVIINDHAIEGYSDSESYSPLDTVHFKIHSTTPYCTIEIIRHGATDSTIASFDSVAVTTQNYNCRSYTFGCDWETTFSYGLPVNLPSGIYSAKLTNDLNQESYICFVVKGNGTAPILVLANTNTWQAYNSWGGSSFYNYDLSEEINQSVIVSFNRPNNSSIPVGDRGHLIEAELHLLRWLENNNYNYEVISDRDLHNGTDISNHKTMVLNVHPEYWTTEMRISLLLYLEGGGNLINMGANGIYWKAGLTVSQIEVRKQDAYHKYTAAGKGGKWRKLGYPESSILGVQYDEKGYNTYHPYQLYNAAHWVFNGTGLSNGDTFGSNCINGNGASGHETDKMTVYSPSSTVFLAKGTNPDNGGATMCYYETSNGSKVFSTGSITFTGSLSVDSSCNRIANNVFTVFSN